MAKSIFEEMGGTYEMQGDYLILRLALPAEEKKESIGVWGQRHARYLKQNYRILYMNLLTSGKLNAYLADIDRQALERFERLTEQIKRAQSITEQLKADNQFEWVR